MQTTTTPTGQVTLTANGSKRKGSSMGADAASWTVSAGFQPPRWCSGGYVLPSPPPFPWHMKYIYSSYWMNTIHPMYKSVTWVPYPVVWGPTCCRREYVWRLTKESIWALVKVFNIPRGACIPFYEKLSPLSVPVAVQLLCRWVGIFVSDTFSIDQAPYL